MCNDITKNNISKISFRAGTDLTYNRIRENGTTTRILKDIAYIKPKDEVYIAISLKTGITALGETPEKLIALWFLSCPIL